MTQKYGFTLIEMLSVIILISILSIFVVINFPRYSINLGGQAQQIANDIRLAQTLAMTRGQRYRWIRLSSTTYQIVNSAGIPLLMPGGTTIVTLSTGITFGTLTNLPNNLINFDGKGIPYTDTSSPGTPLAANASIPLTASGDIETITVNPGTGRVVVT